MDTTLADKAVQLALTQNWKAAIGANLEIIAQTADDIPALNRLAYAYLKSGNINASKTTYKKVLKIDKYNPIAVKNLKLLGSVTKKDIQNDPDALPSPTIFIEEPGKTKIVTLVNPAPIKILCNVMTAQKITFVPKRHTIEIRSKQGVYLGALPDDLSHRLLRFIEAGNTYDAYVKKVQKNTISIFIRELRRARKFANYPSFSITNGITSYDKSLPKPPELVEDEEGNKEESEGENS